MKVKNGKPFTIKTANCIATVTVENFSPKIVDKFNEMLAEQAIKQAERVEAVA